MKNDDKLPWHQRIAVYIIVAGLIALALVVAVGILAIFPNHPGFALCLIAIITTGGGILVANLPLEIKKDTDGPSKSEIFLANLTQDLERMKDL